MNPYTQTNRDLTHSRNPADPGDGSSNTTGNENLPENPQSIPSSANQQVTNRQNQPQYAGGFTRIPPNESRRSKLTTMAQKEMEDLQKWKETNRVPAVNLTPERLGGNVTLAEAREKQLTELRCAKLQKQLKKEEMDKRKRQEEEEKWQKIKAEQREKAERLEERRRREEQQRKEQLRQDHLRTTESFLQRFETTAPGPTTSGAAQTSSWGEAEENKPIKKEEKPLKDIEEERKRVNSAFLDKLERQSRGSEKEVKTEDVGEEECPYLASEGFRHQLFQTSGQHYLKPDPEQSSSGGAEEDDPEPDRDWALMKLVNRFPHCTTAFLEDILAQCNGDYQQTYTLLSDSLI